MSFFISKLAILSLPFLICPLILAKGAEKLHCESVLMPKIINFAAKIRTWEG
jgi:hypothetical protein